MLNDISFTIEPGQTVALVGRSGSGKSTVASLIPRFYEPTSGEILLDGRPLASYTLACLRRQIGLVTQQVTLFNDTLERNIAYGALENAEPAAIREAVERAHADVFIDELPEGLATVVGDDGVLLSGGQRQRVAIARALLKDAPVLILDEATSALDTESERHIQAALEAVMRGRTTLVIAHRLSTIENADLILVMEDGHIVESGTHRSLLDQGGAYAALYDAQFEDTTDRGRATAPAPSHRGRRLAAPIRGTGTPSRMVQAWYRDAPWLRALTPVAWLFRRQAQQRRLAYLTGNKQPWRAPVPVVVVGNIAVGGTGKTPLVVWLARWLKARGFSPGIVSRGYGGRRGREPITVAADADPLLVGDEAPLLAARAAVPVVVCPDRVAAAQHLLATESCDLILCDDGLQHYGLARDVELAVVDGSRGLGNGRCLPAGPLREPPERLNEVDLVLVNGTASQAIPGGVAMTVAPRCFVRLLTSERVSVDEFVQRHDEVHAVAGIGNPGRFAETLAELGLRPILHPYPDHHRFGGEELVFEDDRPVVCTEKDAVKLRRLETVPGHCWYLEIDLALSEDAEARLVEVLHTHGILKA